MSRASAALVLAVLLSACAALQPPQPERASTYLLEATAPAAAPQSGRDLVLVIAQPRARPGFDTPQMAYTRRANEVEYFARNRWAETPARMLAPLIAQVLERSGGFRAVVQAPSTASADLRLDIELVRLQQNFGTQPSRIEFALHAQLIDVVARRVIASARFEEVEGAPSEDPYGGVIAANRALARLLARLVEFCAESRP